MTYDERLSLLPARRACIALDLDGRVEIPLLRRISGGAAGSHRGQADLLYRNDIFYLACTVDAPEPTPNEPDEYLGVDLGIINLATTSDGEIVNQGQGCVHAHVNTVRARYVRLRAKLQKKQSRSARRLLKRRSGRERRFARDVNHGISKAIVQTAQGTARVALETSEVFEGNTARSALRLGTMALLIQWLTSRAKRRSLPLRRLSSRLALLDCFFWSFARNRT